MPLNIDFQQVFLHMFNFVILFGAMYFLLFAPIKKFMDHRNDTLEKTLKDADGKMEAALAVKADYDARIGSVEDEITAMKERAKAEAQADAARIREEAKDEAGRIIAEARHKGRTEQEAILRSANRTLSELAQEAAGRLLIEDSEEGYDCFLELVEKNRGK